MRIATICARGGSKGLPGKNTRLFLGVPLIARSIHLALGCGAVSGVYVSTDSEDIAAVARAHGATVLGMRPAALATDTAPKLPALAHLVAQVEAHAGAVSSVLDLQPTSPLTAAQDIAACLSEAAAYPNAGLVTTAFDSGSNPYYTMVEADANGFARLSKTHIATRRQDAPKVLTLNGAVYLWQRDALLHAAQQGLWSVPVRTVEMPKLRSADIDDATDWAVAEALAKQSGLQEPA